MQSLKFSGEDPGHARGDGIELEDKREEGREEENGSDWIMDHPVMVLLNRFKPAFSSSKLKK